MVGLRGPKGRCQTSKLRASCQTKTELPADLALAKWLLGVDATYRNLTLGVAYVDTDISAQESAYLRPSFSNGQDGTGSIADGTFVFSLTAVF